MGYVFIDNIIGFKNKKICYYNNQFQVLIKDELLRYIIQAIVRY